jgi:hypothetical protein
LDRRVGRPDLSRDLDSTSVGELDVEDGNIRRGRRDARESLLRGSGVADDLHVVFGFEKLAHPTPDDLVIVEEEDADRAIVHRRGV